MDISVILKFLSLVAIILAAFFWTSAQVNARTRYNDEQTLIAGAIWTQVLISLGLIISAEVNDRLNPFVHGYFLVGGLTLPILAGIVLMVIQCKKWRSNALTVESTVEVNDAPRRWLNKPYLIISILCLLSGLFTLIDFLLLIILPEQDRVQWLRSKFMKRK